MNKVIKMLEGMVEGLELPPRPSFYKNETYRHENISSRHDDISSDFSEFTYSDSQPNKSITLY